MAVGICFGVLLLSSVWTEHLSYGLASYDAQKGVPKYSGSSKIEFEQRMLGSNYDQDQFRPASGISGSGQNNIIHRGTGSNPYSQRPSFLSFDSSSYKSTPKSPFTSAQTVGKRVRSKIFDFLLSDSIASGSSFSHKHNTLASGSSDQSVLNANSVKAVSSWEAKRAHPIHAEKILSLRPHSSSSGSAQSATQKSRLLNSKKQISMTQTGSFKSRDNTLKSSYGQSVRFPDFPSSAVSNQKHSTGVATLSNDVKMLLSSGPVEFSAQSNSPDKFPQIQVPSLGSSQALRPGPQSFAMKSKRPNFSPVVKPYQSNHASASGSGLSSKHYSQTASTIQKPIGFPAAIGQPSYTLWKSDPSSARGPNHRISSSSYGPAWTLNRNGASTPKRLAPTTTHNIPKLYGGSPIRRLKHTLLKNSDSASSLRVSKPQLNPNAPSRLPTSAYVRVKVSRWEPSL
ncbi:uncharacterized protein LOC105012631 [Esox lucius]|uniref:uncharacterized protein LOC105012631 n=1 Tax=Esox lucius TaxID=8010 RepID=UPI001476C50D|nr:uncharacterized protein LOC105012631 [Esox lucius]